MGKKEKSTKAALKKQLEDNANISNEKVSQMLKSVKGCKDSTKTLANMKVKLAAEQKKYKQIQVDYKKCEAKKKAQQAKMKHIKSKKTSPVKRSKKKREELKAGRVTLKQRPGVHI